MISLFLLNKKKYKKRNHILIYYYKSNYSLYIYMYIYAIYADHPKYVNHKKHYI